MRLLNIFWFGSSLCHRIPERSFHWNGRQLPVCARCTGLRLGLLTFPLFLFGVLYINMWWSALLVLPLAIDGLTQAIFHRESNNRLRLVTGILAAVGLGALACEAGRYLAGLVG